MFKQKLLIIVITIIYIVPLVLYFLLSLYLEHSFKKLQTLDSAKRLKYLASLSFYLILVFVALLVIRLIVTTRTILITEQSSAMQFFNLDYILLVTFVFLFSWMFLAELKIYKWFREHAPPTILAVSLFQQHIDLLRAQNFDQAKDCLIKACELVPDNVFHWSFLGHLCEMLYNNHDEANQYMDKAKSILDSAKEPNPKEVACYENLLGYILCNRGQTEEGLKHIEKSIELDPNPGRIKTYKKRLAKLNQQDNENTSQESAS